MSDEVFEGPVDVQYVVSTLSDMECTVVRTGDAVAVMLPPGERITGGLVFSPGQAFQLGRALVELGFFNEDGDVTP